MLWPSEMSNNVPSAWSKLAGAVEGEDVQWHFPSVSSHTCNGGHDLDLIICCSVPSPCPLAASIKCQTSPFRKI
ncbi:hypothetical protein XELAEV_18023979mg [Xenopus laevis]|uniref:Uncharacterized protein n=1 Tax=Xenopus laevis TaxID=8355 RepID=A0A974D714_XENLA|nr:hypothetical protein XELAEV_18023979mg [Xenopus laevis]